MKNKKIKVLSISLVMFLLSGCSATSQETDTTIEVETIETVTITEQETSQESMVGETTTVVEATTIVESATTEENTDVSQYIEIPLQEYQLELTGDTTPEMVQM